MLNDHGSRFGMAFETAAQLSGTNLILDRFENAVMEINASELSEFVEKLHLSLSASL